MALYSQDKIVTVPGLLAGANLTAAQYHIVKLASTAGEVVLAGNGAGFGVLLNDPADGEVAEVAWSGIVPVVAEASVTKGTLITANSTGRAQATTTANNAVLGVALTGSTSNGDLISLALSGVSNY